MKNSINIFSETGCIQHEMLWKYRQGKLSAVEKHAVEVHLTDCELCSDALAGMMVLQSDEVIAGLRKSVRKISAPKKVIRFYDYRILSAAAAAAVVIVFYVVNSPDKHHKEEIAQLTVPAPEEPRKDEQATVANIVEPQSDSSAIDFVPQVNEDVLSKEKSLISANVAFPDSSSSSLVWTYSNSNSNVACDPGALSTQPNFKAPPEELAREKTVTVNIPDATDAQAEPDGNTGSAQSGAVENRTQEEKTTDTFYSLEKNDKKAEPSRQLKTSVERIEVDKKPSSGKKDKNPESSKIMYINDLKVAKTPAMLASENLDTVDAGSLPPKYENEEQKAAETTVGRELPFVYSKTLRDGMNYFYAKRYKDASQTFSIILERLPNDVNSQFYKGLSEMEMNNYSPSASLLNQAMLNSDKTFYEEAKFKLALCYIALNQKANAENLLKEIIAEKGFYSEKAAKELKRLK